MQFLV
jgi:hypothetical protein